MKKILIVALICFLVSCRSEHNIDSDYTSQESAVDESDNQLWLMIRTKELFRSDRELKIKDDLIEIIENSNLGRSDGCGSGGYQFDMNFLAVSDFVRTKNLIDTYMAKNHPKIEYVISSDYETSFDKPQE